MDEQVKLELKNSDKEKAAKVDEFTEEEEAKDTFDLPVTTTHTKNSTDESDKEDSEKELLIISNGSYRTTLFINYMYNHKHKKLFLAVFFFLIYLIEWSYAFCYTITSSLSPLATSSYSEHSQGLASISIATTIISAVCRPFLAKLADNASRPICYIVVILFVLVGNVVVAASHSISAYVVGAGVASVGTSGIDFINSLIVADITPLKWRGFATALLSTPYIYNAWFSALVVADLEVSQWRWGYGMFALMLSVISIPIIAMMMIYEHKAIANEEKKHHTKTMILKNIYEGFIEVDGLGLLLLGTGFTILLLPLSLYATVSNGWKNPSIIAMFVIGGVILIIFVLFERYLSPYPIMPKQVWNKTLLCCVSCDFFYELSTQVALLYFTSYTYVVLDLSLTDWSYLNNAVSVSMCFFGVVTGLLHRYTHRYKMWQILGFVIQIIGSGILIQTDHKATSKLANLAASYTLIGVGAGFSTVSTNVALQASVPHKDLGISISFMSLFSNVGAAIGYAIAAVIWEGKMYNALRKHLPSTVTDEEVLSFYGSIYDITAYPVGTEVRDNAIVAYQEVNYYLFTIELGLSFIPLIISFFQTNFYLGDTHNMVEEETVENGKSSVIP